MDQIWCIPTDCVPFLAAATSWDQLYINLGNKFLFDTTDKILTQIRDLIDLDEPSINQDLLIANVSEKIFYDYRSIIRNNINETYEEGINEVYNQYKYIISSRAASGDIPDQCVKEVVCSIEQFKNRLLARAGKIKNESKQLMKNLSDNNDINVQSIIHKTRSISLPTYKTNDEEIRSYQTRQTDIPKFESNSISKIHSSHRRTKKINTKHIPNEFNEKTRWKNPHKQRSDHFRKEHDTFIPFTDCSDYDPYRNYEKYKEKRLHMNKNVF